MTDETKQALQLALTILKETCVKEGVSLAVDKETGTLNFFDTATYLATKKFDGIKVEPQNLVR